MIATAHAPGQAAGPPRGSRRPGRVPRRRSPPAARPVAACPTRPKPPPGRGRGAASKARTARSADAPAVVTDLHLEAVGPVVQDDGRLRRAGVFECVRQGLLDDPVGVDLDSRGQPPGGAVDLELHRQPRLAHVRQEEGQPVETGLRSAQRSRGLRAQQVHQPAQPVEGVPANRLDRARACPPAASPSGSVRRTAAACATITLTSCATMSCTSRAMRARSSITAA